MTTLADSLEAGNGLAIRFKMRCRPGCPRGEHGFDQLILVGWDEATHCDVYECTGVPYSPPEFEFSRVS